MKNGLAQRKQINPQHSPTDCVTLTRPNRSGQIPGGSGKQTTKAIADAVRTRGHLVDGRLLDNGDCILEDPSGVGPRAY